MTASRGSGIYDRARAWLDEQWDPRRELGEWWQLLADSGWGYPSWPTNRFGRGLDHAGAREVRRAFSVVGAMPSPFGVATLMAVPTFMELGEEELLDRYLGDIATGKAWWCQLFS